MVIFNYKKYLIILSIIMVVGGYIWFLQSKNNKLERTIIDLNIKVTTQTSEIESLKINNKMYQEEVKKQIELNKELNKFIKEIKEKTDNIKNNFKKIDDNLKQSLIEQYNKCINNNYNKENNCIEILNAKNNK